MTGLTKCLELDGRAFNIAYGKIDISNSQNEITTEIAKGAAQANGSIRLKPWMDVQHVIRSILHMAELPLDANVQFMTIQARDMPWIGRG